MEDKPEAVNALGQMRSVMLDRVNNIRNVRALHTESESESESESETDSQTERHAHTYAQSRSKAFFIALCLSSIASIARSACQLRPTIIRIR